MPTDSPTAPLILSTWMLLQGCAAGTEAAPSRAEAAAPTAPAPATFTATDPAFAAYLKRFPALDLPAVFPPAPASRAAVLARRIEGPDMERFVCASKFYACKIRDQRQEAFAVGRLPLSSRAVALVVLVQGDIDTPLILLTHGPDGSILGGHLVGGEIGDSEYGFTGALAANGRDLSVGRHVWVNGVDRVDTEDLSFRLQDNGDVDLESAP